MSCLLGAPVILNCSVEEEYRIVWNVDPGTGSLFRSDVELNILLNRGRHYSSANTE